MRASTAALELVALLTACALTQSAGSQASSSYFDEFFPLTARLALNKIQQSFGSARGNTTNASEEKPQLSGLLQTTTTTTISPSISTHSVVREQQNGSSSNQAASVEPSGANFVNFNVSPELPSQIKTEADPIEQAGKVEAQIEQVAKVNLIPAQTDSTQTLTNQSATSLNSTESSQSVQSNTESLGSTSSTIGIDSKQPTTESSERQANSAASGGQSTGELPAKQPQSESPSSSLNVAANEEAAPTVVIESEQTNNPANYELNFNSLQSGPGQSSGPPSQFAVDPQVSRPSAESVLRTELEAQSAVEASMGFGDMFGALSDTCYDEYGNARFCEPEFENIAFERAVETSSECGSPPARFCLSTPNERQEQLRNCHICDSKHPKRKHPNAYLTDAHNPTNPTCWVSAPLTSQTSLDQLQKSDNVTLTLNFDKKFELAYVSLQFCSSKPDSLAIYKTLDSGRSWSAYQFYSSQCKRVYGRQARDSNWKLADQLEASCLAANSSGGGFNSQRLSFSTMDGRSQVNLEKSAALQDWITATGVKVVLDRHQASNWPHSQATELATKPLAASQQLITTSEQQPSTGSNSSLELEKPSDAFSYALADFTVGGRCKCNGHASRCVHDASGRLQCDCRHNTAGRDCERCAPFHLDRPWNRATQFDANPCQPCNCNGHSRKCHFDAELYRLSGRRSGGVCDRCRDNTAGRHCHYCVEGFTRDHSKPMTDKEACKPCDCHALGSIGRVCNHLSGQCTCKEGVTGLQCNRCAPGYQQSNTASEPCIKIPENNIDGEAADEQPDELASSSRPFPANNADASEPNEASDGAEYYGQDELEDMSPNMMTNGRWPSSPRQSTPRQNRHRRPNNLQSSAWYPQQQQHTSQSHNFNGQFNDELDASQMDQFAPSQRSPKGRNGQQLPRAPLFRYPLDQNNMESADPGAESGFFSSDERQSSSLSLGSRSRFAATRRPMSELSNELSCGDCHLATKRLTSSHFCQAGYAIKATILNMLVSEDWTRVYVEVQDTFKVPLMSSGGQQQQQLHHSRPVGFLDDNSLQSDEPSSGSQPMGRARSLASNASETGTDVATPNGQKIRIGSIQSIWIPTEDLSCKCPRLKLSSTYLIMGSLDAKESSLQLDRHGFALEWRPNLQEKAAKLQRRVQSKPRCWTYWS